MSASHYRAEVPPGPLRGTRIIEMAGLGAVPFCGMLLSDMGAEVIRIDRPGGWGDAYSLDPRSMLARGRRSVVLEIGSDLAREAALRLIASADVLIEGFRPGVMENLGLGPTECQDRNRRLVYGRLTGWGQVGPLSATAGHDINYIALSGALGAIGNAGEAPVFPLNILGDFAGGGMLLAFGLLCALLEAGRTGVGQVIDAAMVDGAALYTTLFHEMMARGDWTDQRGVNQLDGGTHYYNVYETRDGRHMAVGAVEPRFFTALLAGMGLDPGDVPFPSERDRWEEGRRVLAEAFATRTQAEWVEIFEGTDACVTPVLSLHDATAHDHTRARETFVEVAGVVQPAPAPRIGDVRRNPDPAPVPGAHTEDLLAEIGLAPAEIDALRSEGAIGRP